MLGLESPEWDYKNVKIGQNFVKRFHRNRDFNMLISVLAYTVYAKIFHDFEFIKIFLRFQDFSKISKKNRKIERSPAQLYLGIDELVV